MEGFIDEKLKKAEVFINGLSGEYRCQSFHHSTTKRCDCIKRHADCLTVLKETLLSEVNLFWNNQNEIGDVNNQSTAGTNLGLYLQQKCTYASSQPFYSFNLVDNTFVNICLPTVTRLFGLSQAASRHIRAPHVDTKKIGLGLLKLACQKSFQSGDYNRSLYRNKFPHNVVPCSPHNKAARDLLHDVLHGGLVELNAPALEAMDHAFHHYLPFFDDFTRVDRGGDNILYAHPRVLPPWNSFDSRKKTKALPEFLKPVIFEYWKEMAKPREVPMKCEEICYHTNFLLSHLKKKERISLSKLTPTSPK
jgi:hypothetical protein